MKHAVPCKEIVNGSRINNKTGSKSSPTKPLSTTHLSCIYYLKKMGFLKKISKKSNFVSTTYQQVHCTRYKFKNLKLSKSLLNSIHELDDKCTWAFKGQMIFFSNKAATKYLNRYTNINVNDNRYIIFHRGL